MLYALCIRTLISVTDRLRVRGSIPDNAIRALDLRVLGLRRSGHRPDRHLRRGLSRQLVR